MAKVAKFRAVRFGDKLARSSRIFLLGLVVACGVEVIVDWNQTFWEINNLRDQVRQKSFHYAGLVQRVVGDDLETKELREVKRLANGILDDEDACYVRITDASDNVLHEETRDDFDATFAKRGMGPSFREHYASFMERDIAGVLSDPEGFRASLVQSRYRDLPQLWSDFIAEVSGYVMAPTPPPTRSNVLVYQDRLRTHDHLKDDRTTWSIGTISSSKGQTVGAVLIAFDMERTNKAVRTKYLKGFGIVIFFVALILVQNVLGRRDKLRLLDLEERYKNAKQTLRDALPQRSLKTATLVVEGALNQAQGPVDGMVFDLCETANGAEILVVDPDGDGIDAAAIGLHMLKVFRARRKASEGRGDPTLEEELTALGAATEDIPLTRPIAALLLRVSADGEFESLFGERATLHLLEGQGASAVEPVPTDAEAPKGVVGPLHRAKGTIPLGATLLIAVGGPDTGPFAQAKKKKDVRLDAAALAKFALRSKAGFNVADAAVWARGKTGGMSEDDIVVLAVTRAA